jgi:hypothetical protein
MQLQSLLSPVRIPVDLEIAGEAGELTTQRLNLTVRPLTPKLIDELPADPMGQLARLLIDWDLESETEKVPATEESLRSLPIDLVAELSKAVQDFFYRRIAKSAN